MSLSVSFSREASAELAEAASWYDEQRAGLGAELIAAVDATVQRIEDHPKLGSRPPGVADPNIRRLFVRRFPFHLVYIDLGDRLQVLAVAHDRRRPRYWAGRRST